MSTPTPLQTDAPSPARPQRVVALFPREKVLARLAAAKI